MDKKIMDTGQKYKSLKVGWIPLTNLAVKYGLNSHKRNKLVLQLGEEAKEQIGTLWIVLECEALKYL